MSAQVSGSDHRVINQIVGTWTVYIIFIKGTLMQIWKSPCMKTIPWKFSILIPNDFLVICPWRL